jgi:hypothetical protein
MRNRILFVTLVLLAVSVTVSAQTYSSIEKMPGWETCDSCAGSAPANHWMQIGANSTQFSIAGSQPFADALWWKQLGANPNANHFIYDLWVYATDALTQHKAQAFEFDVNQSVYGHKYIFGTECVVGYTKRWMVWGNNQWQDTGLPCTFNANVWNHLTLEFTRSGGLVVFNAVTLNGFKQYINRQFAPNPSGVNELNTAVQIDQTASRAPYSVWVRNMQLIVD